MFWEKAMLSTILMGNAFAIFIGACSRDPVPYFCCLLSCFCVFVFSCLVAIYVFIYIFVSCLQVLTRIVCVVTRSFAGCYYYDYFCLCSL